MSVTSKVRVNVVADLGAICQDLQQKLDQKNDELTRMTLKKAAADEVSDHPKVIRTINIAG